MVYDDAGTRAGWGPEEAGGVVVAEAAGPVDDEYRSSGIRDPQLLLTTCSGPSHRLLQFAQELRHILPNCVRVSRGSHSIPALVEAARQDGYTDMIVLHENRGVPDGMVICHLPFGPTLYAGLVNVVLRHDIEAPPPIREVYPHLIVDGFTTTLGRRVVRILTALFPVPRPTSPRIITLANRDDYVIFRHHVYQKHPTDPRDVVLEEIGPRFELRVYEIRLGTMDERHAEPEWKLALYTNTAARKALL